MEKLPKHIQEHYDNWIEKNRITSIEQLAELPRGTSIYTTRSGHSRIMPMIYKTSGYTTGKNSQYFMLESTANVTKIWVLHRSQIAEHEMFIAPNGEQGIGFNFVCKYMEDRTIEYIKNMKHRITGDNINAEIIADYNELYGKE